MRKIVHEKAVLNRDDKLKIKTELYRMIEDLETIENEPVNSLAFICYARGIRGSAERLLEVFEKRVLKDEAKKEKKRLERKRRRKINEKTKK